MKKHLAKIVSILLVFAMLFSFAAACAPKETGDGEHTHHYENGYCTICGEADPNYNPGGGDITGDDDFSYYATTALREDKKVYTLNYGGEMSNDDLNTASAIQGLFARKEVTFYIDGKYLTNGTNADQYYMTEAEEKYGITAEESTLQEAVQMYIDSWDEMVADGTWGSQIDLKEGFKDDSGAYNAYQEEDQDSAEAGYNSPGYIVYRSGQVSVNVASTLAGITGFLPVSEDDTEKYDEMGLVKKMDVTSGLFDYYWLFNACMTELSSGGLIHQNYVQNGLTNYYVRDIGVMNKYMYVYYDSDINAPQSLRKQIHSFLDKNIPILGYAFNETQDVALFSQYGQFLVPTDYSMNVTFHLAEDFRQTDGFTQPNDDTTKTAEQGKHYVAFVVSDGDNAQYWQNTAIFSTSYMNATGRENDDFAVTWSISPSIAELMPLVMDTAYNGNITTENDYFCAPVSGQGYIDAGNFYNAGAEYMNTFLGNLDTYLKRSDLSVTTIIGAENYSGGIYGTLNAYAGVESLEGGLVLHGNKYFGGAYSGGVYWKNGKPFIVPRDSLWSTTPAYIAARINMYSATATGHDPTNIDAYSVINVHPWSHNYEDIRTIVGMLNDNVEVVSLDCIVNMMRENVTDQADSTEFEIPASGSGQTITEDDLKEDPSVIPTDPLENDFLLWEEDWSGDVTYYSGDDATSDVYPTFKTNIGISGNGTANKAAFTLPNVDDVWISFYARANSTNASDSTTFKMTMTVDGVEKTVIASATLKGVAGTNTATVTGDGWQAFAFPLAQYFPEYKGKQATVKLEVTGSIGIKLDMFRVTDRYIVEGDDTVCEDPYSNEFEEGRTEDWMLGDQWQTSQYYHWSAIDRESGTAKGQLQVDASDGGGNEKRNGNTNVWFAKCVAMPDTQDELTLATEIGGGAKCKLAMYVDGYYIVLQDWATSSTLGAKEVSLTAAYREAVGDDTASLAGKQVTFVYEVRDNASGDNGVGQDYNLSYFRINWAGKEKA